MPKGQRAQGTERLASTANLPRRLSDRVTASRRARWELSELLAAALDGPQLSADDADSRLASLTETMKIQRHYRLTTVHRNRLDTIAEQWRMSRSDAIAVLLDAELTRRGLG